MKINKQQILYQQQYICNVKTMKNNMFEEKLNSAKNSIVQDEYKKETNSSILGVYSNSTPKSAVAIEFPLETKGYKIEEAEQFEGVQAYILTDKLTGNNFYIREDQLVIQKDEKSGYEFVMNMDQPYSYNIRVTEEFKTLLQDLANTRGFDLNEIPMKNNMTVKKDNKTGLEYLITEGREWEGVSVIIKSVGDLDKLKKLTDTFSAYSIGSDQHVASLYALLEIGGSLRRGKEGLVYFTDKWITYASYDGDRSKSWALEMEDGFYSVAKKTLYTDFDFSSSGEWLKKLNATSTTSRYLNVWDSFSLYRTGYSYKMM